MARSIFARKRLLWEPLALVAVAAAIVVGLQLAGRTRPAPAEESPTPIQFGQATQERVSMSEFADGRLIVRTAMKELSRPLPDPLDPNTVYRYVSSGYAKRQGAVAGSQASRRFEVYAEDEPGLTHAARSCRLLLRLWDMLSTRLKMDHPLAYGRRVTVFLKKGGRPGAEQKIVAGADATGRVIKRNAIYLYDVGGLSDPLEFCRELAHEYGHAVLPAVGGFTEPEHWVNGHIGEALFLRWLLEEMEAGRIEQTEAFDLDVGKLRVWVRDRVEPPASRVLRDGFDPRALQGGDRTALDALLGLVLAVDSTYGPEVLGRGMLLAGGTTAPDVYAGIGRALREREEVAIGDPPALSRFWVYLPGGDWTVEGAAVDQVAKDWGLLRPAKDQKMVARHPLEPDE
jgi:hypothetical protein